MSWWERLLELRSRMPWVLAGVRGLAAAACGADGLLIEVHRDPDHAWSDGPQCLNSGRFRPSAVGRSGPNRSLLEGLGPIASACRREL